jgi:hypothetical protein
MDRILVPGREIVYLVNFCQPTSLGGIKAINREVDWHAHDLNHLFASFPLHFPHLPFSVFASVPLAQLKFAELGCQKFRIREVGWQKEGLEVR